LGMSSAADPEPETLMDRLEVTAAPFGVTEDGENEQVAPEGSALHESVTAE
jgi:hypothetical protein